MHTLTSAVANLELPPPRKSTYTRAMLINLILLRHHMSADNCVWKMFAQDPCQFNEDVGETAMAILARVSEVKPCKGQKLELSNKIFRRLKLLSAIPTQFTEVTTDERERQYELSHQCPEVTQSIAFLKRFVGSASINGLTEYHKTSFEKEADAVTSCHDVVFMARFKAMDVTSQLTSDCPHFIRQLSKRFFQNVETNDGWFDNGPPSSQPCDSEDQKSDHDQDDDGDRHGHVSAEDDTEPDTQPSDDPDDDILPPPSDSGHADLMNDEADAPDAEQFRANQRRRKRPVDVDQPQDQPVHRQTNDRYNLRQQPRHSYDLADGFYYQQYFPDGASDP